MRLAVRQLILYAGCLFIVACLRRLLPAFPVGFFPSFASENGLEDIETGLILAAYPLGMSISSQFAPKIVWRLGPRRACMFSLAAMAPFVAMFGFVPDVSNEKGARVALFLSLLVLCWTGCGTSRDDMLHPDYGEFQDEPAVGDGGGDYRMRSRCCRTL